MKAMITTRGRQTCIILKVTPKFKSSVRKTDEFSRRNYKIYRLKGSRPHFAFNFAQKREKNHTKVKGKQTEVFKKL